MKKYQQLLLVILSVLSFVSLLIYRHQYNKLRYVLKVLNFFGTPGLSAHANFSQQSLSAEKYLMSEPLPAWQRLSDTLYLYSAYWETLDVAKGHVKATALGVLNENLNYGCYLWYESNPEPVKAQFSFSELPRRSPDSTFGKTKDGSRTAKSTKNKGFTFYCEAIKEQSIPIGVTFYRTSRGETSHAFLPVYKIRTESPVQNSTAVCVLPDEYSSLKKLIYLEFLSFHRAIGIKNFIIYGANYQYGILSNILRDPSYDISLIILQWNYPFFGDNDLTMDIAQNDCIQRASGLFENVITLKWNQFFVPKTHSSAGSVISKLDPDKRISTFQVPISVFCLEFQDDPNATDLPVIFRKTKSAFLKSDASAFVFNTNVKNVSARKVSRDLVTVNWYVKCSSLDLKMKKSVDRSITAFQSEVMQSKIMRL